jgi:hypothetical protein
LLLLLHLFARHLLRSDSLEHVGQPRVATLEGLLLQAEAAQRVAAVRTHELRDVEADLGHHPPAAGAAGFLPAPLMSP